MVDTRKTPHAFKFKFLSTRLAELNAIFSENKANYAVIFDKVEELRYGTFYHYVIYTTDKEAETYFKLKYG